jgi:hypothetical protein
VVLARTSKADMLKVIALLVWLALIAPVGQRWPAG